MQYSSTHAYRTAGGIRICRASMGLEYGKGIGELAEALDSQAGVLFSSGYEYPGRYTRWDLGFVNPPLRLTARGRRIEIDALNTRGEILLAALRPLRNNADMVELEDAPHRLAFNMRTPEPVRTEEERTRQRSVFTFLRQLLAHFASPEDSHLGLYGAFGYELAFQFEAVRRRLPRQRNARDLVLYVPDTILVVDHKRETAQQHFYDFEFDQAGETFSTRHLPRSGTTAPFLCGPATSTGIRCDHPPGAYAGTVRKALQYFARGDLFEAVPGQSFFGPCRDSPAQIFRRLQRQNPAPYGALLNLGEDEYLVAASPEMFVRVEGRRVETCPISGTIARGRDALEDAERIRALLNSAKDEAELSMCTDVDRNDKSRVCEPGSIRVLGRRQIEMYSRLIHTVDHVEGRLKPGFDALDAFLSHAWAVTVTGAPKQAAIQFIEDHELTPRAWYGGALGCLNFNGDLNTGLTIRTMRIKDGMAEVRAGATLLFDSDPDAEEAETRLKASALLRALEPGQALPHDGAKPKPAANAPALRVLMVDHQDSFVHTLSSYFQEAGAQVVTVRPEGVAGMIAALAPQLIVLSPGPGRPADFGLELTIGLAFAANIPLFGVCLGLQGIVEYFGGSLRTLDYPMHGKASLLAEAEGFLFAGLERPLRIGRYHSLVADVVPGCLKVCARTGDGEVMALMHESLPLAAVQFHPESILSMDGDKGRALIRNVVAMALAACTADAARALQAS